MDYTHSNTWFVGSELKFAISIERRGFNMLWDGWQVTVSRGDKSIVCNRDKNSIQDSEGQWYFLVDTNELGVGTYKIKVEIDVPDDDFPDKACREVYGQNLIKVTSI